MWVCTYRWIQSCIFSADEDISYPLPLHVVLNHLKREQSLQPLMLLCPCWSWQAIPSPSRAQASSALLCGLCLQGCYCHDVMPKLVLWKVNLYRAQTTPSGCPSSGSGTWRSRALSTSFPPDPGAKSKLIMVVVVVVVVTTLHSKEGGKSYAHWRRELTDPGQSKTHLE